MLFFRGGGGGSLLLACWLAANSAWAETGIRLLSRTITPPREREESAKFSPAALQRLQERTDAEDAWIVLFHEQIPADARQALENAGQPGAYLPDNAFTLYALPGDVFSLATGRTDVVWVDLLLPSDRVSPELMVQAMRAGMMPGARAAEPIEVLIGILRDIGVDDVQEAITQAGGEVTGIGSSARRTTLRALLPPDAVAAPAALPQVEWIQPYIEPVLFNNVAGQTNLMNITPVYEAPFNLTGSGQIVAVCDTGLDTGDIATIHPDFSNRVIAAYSWGRTNDWSDPHGHGTHCAGSVLGSGEAYSNGLFRGSAYEASLVFQSIQGADGGLDLPDELADLFLQAHTNGARIHSDSWGGNAAGAYTTADLMCDEFMWDYPDFLLVYAAGNEGEDADGDGVVDPGSIATPGSAKNVLAVGAATTLRPAGSGGYTARTWGEFGFPYPPLANGQVSWPADNTNQGMAAFSSRGPTADGRFKPDIAAPGTDIISCRSRVPGASTGWGTGEGVLANNASNYYVFMGGTSMATPLTAGAAALFRQYLTDHRAMPQPSAALLKAFMMAGARSLAPGQFGVGDSREIPLTPRPNNVEGWGHLDAANAIFPAGGTNIFLDGSTLTTAADTTLAIEPGAGMRLSVVLAWTDYPATPLAAAALVNDLDLEITTPDSRTLRPGGSDLPDRVNNVEGIDVSPTLPGTYTIRIRGYNVPCGPQPFALAVHTRPLVVPGALRTIWHEPEFVPLGTNAALRALAQSGTNGPVALTNYYRINGGEWTPATMEPLWMRPDQQVYSTEAPPLDVGDTLEYCVTALMTDGTVVHSPTQTIFQWGAAIHVATGGSGTAPYDTPEKALTNLHAALALAPRDMTIRVGPGTWQSGGSPFTPARRVRLQSANGSAETILDGGGLSTVISNGVAAVLDGFTITGGFNENEASAGGVMMSGGALLNCRIANNTGYHAGGISAVSAGVISNCVIEGNTGTQAGGVNLFGLVHLLDSVVRNNSGTDGGGVHVVGTQFVVGIPPHVDRCVIVSNRASSMGGGIFVISMMGFGVVNNSLIAGNEAATNGGGAAFSSFFPGGGAGNTFYGNTSPGAALYAMKLLVPFEMPAPLVMLDSCIFAGHNGPDVQVDTNNNDRILSLAYCSMPVQPADPLVESLHAIYADPRFRDAPGGNFRLRANSPCIGTGSTNPVDQASSLDLARNPRIMGGRRDIGAYEYGPLGVSTTALHFAADVGGPNPGAQSLVLTNLCADAMAYLFENTSNAPWCAIQPAFGVLNGFAAAACPVTVNAAGLPWGTHTAPFTIKPAGPDTTPQYLAIHLTLEPAAATVELTGLAHTYDGTAKSATATTDPEGLEVAFTYNGTTNLPLNAGDYAVLAEIRHHTFAGSATGLLTIARGEQTVSFANPGEQRLTNVLNLAAAASSGLPVAFSVLTGPGTIQHETNLAFFATGIVAVAANQAGNSNWNAAVQVTRAFLVKNEFTLAILSAHESCLPTVGNHILPAGTRLTNTLASPITGSSTQYAGIGWTLTGNDPASGNENMCILTLTNDAVLLWRWTTNVLIEIEINGRGTIQPAPAEWQPLGAELTLNAVPATGSRFLYWEGDTQGDPADPVQTFVMDRMRRLAVAFGRTGLPPIQLLLLEE